MCAGPRSWCGPPSASTPSAGPGSAGMARGRPDEGGAGWQVGVPGLYIVASNLISRRPLEDSPFQDVPMENLAGWVEVATPITPQIVL